MSICQLLIFNWPTSAQANTCLGVFGLSLYTTERELEKEFGKFGPIAKITVVLDGKTGRSRGFAFVTFEKVEDATEARNAMSDSGLLSFHVTSCQANSYICFSLFILEDSF